MCFPTCCAGILLYLLLSGEPSSIITYVQRVLGDRSKSDAGSFTSFLNGLVHENSYLPREPALFLRLSHRSQSSKQPRMVLGTTKSRPKIATIISIYVPFRS